MNNRFRLRALDAESVYMRHDIVTDFLFPFFRHIIIDIVLVSLHLIDLLLGHRQAQLLFRFRQSDPQLSPSAEFHIRRKQVFHLLIRIAGRQGRFVNIFHQ